jgi:hypothetical protein
MKKIIHGLFIAGILSIFAFESHAQIAINLKSQKKYQRKHSPDLLNQKHLKKSDFRKKADSKQDEAVYQKILDREKRHTARTAERHIKHQKLNARVKEKDKVGI